jgi:glycosyltransferase involved in cell wall biosynthesis
MVSLSFRFPHHGKYSSYHRLLDYGAEEDIRVDASLSKAVQGSALLNPRGIATRTWRKLKEAQAWHLARSRDEAWVHYFYPEQGYYRGVKFRRAGQKILFTCHLPKEVHERARTKLVHYAEGLKAADGIILMSPDDLDYYAAVAPRARVTFIPHGIDIHRFTPAEGRERKTGEVIELLTVGNMEREFERLAAVIREADEMDAPLRFNVVALPHYLGVLKGFTGEKAWRRVRALSGIDDDALLDLYRSCDLLFLPLRAATANNALLEALATGLPMLLSDLPACRAYARDCAIYFPAEEGAAGLVERMAGTDIAGLREMAAAGRVLAERELAWEIIAARQREFMRSIDALA